MNENNLNNGKYKATSNLNTAIENPQINVKSTTDVNVQDLGYNNYVDSNDIKNNNFLNNSYVSQNEDNTNTTNINSNNKFISSDDNLNTSYVSNNTYTTSTNINNDSYTPTLNEKKIDDESLFSNLLHSKEFKILIFIMFILCLFLLIMPYVYDFVKNIKLMR